MKRHRLIKMFALAGLPLLALLWFVLFFFPVTVEMSQVKRQIKDLGDQLHRNANIGDRFVLSDQSELDRIAAAVNELRDGLPHVAGADGFLRLMTVVSAFLKETAATEGLNNLIVSSNSQDLEINAQTLPQSGQALEELLQFTSNRLREIQTEGKQNQTGASAEADGKGPFGLSTHNLLITFSGGLKPALTFLHRLPELDRSLRTERLVISEGLHQPLFLVHARLDYWTVPRADAVSRGTQAAASPTTEIEPDLDWTDPQGDLVIDADSPLLLERISPSSELSEPYLPLSTRFGMDIFVGTANEVNPVQAELPVQTESLQLNGIVVDGDRRLAIVNRQLVREGEYVGSALIVRITPGQVLCRSNGQEIVLELDRLTLKQSGNGGG